VINRRKTYGDGANYDAKTKNAANPNSGLAVILGLHISSLSKETQPERECEQRCQARISQYGNRQHDVNAREYPMAGNREYQAECQADEPCRKEGTQNFEGWGPAATRAERERERQPKR
jgi:hypothetical protein